MELKRLKSISLVLAVLMTLCLFVGVSNVAGAAEPAFNDLDGYEWAADALADLKDAGIIQGDGSGNFNPGENISRAGLASLLCSAFNLSPDPNAPSSFSGDLTWNTQNSWDIQYIEAAKDYFYYSGDVFNPGNNVTREEMVFSIVKVLGLNTNGVSTAEAEAKYYKDWTSIGDAYKPSVAFATNLGFVAGDGNGSFNPTTSINRAEMAVFLYRALNFGGGIGQGMFSDVKPGDWYYDAIMNFVNRGIVEGNEEGEFEPDNPVINSDLPLWIAKILNIDTTVEGYDPMADPDVLSKLPSGFVSDESDLTREKAAYTVAKSCYPTIPEDVEDVLGQFSDNSVIDDAYRAEVAALVDAGYIKGSYTDGNLIFNPRGSVTRAQLIVMLVDALPTSGTNENVSGQVFSDVAVSDWFYDGVMNLYNRGIIRGFPDGRFGPDLQIGNSMIYLVARHLGLGNNVTDPQVLAYFPNNIYSETKEATAYALLKMLEVETTNVNADAILTVFNDADQISTECRQTMAYLVSIGALRGDGNGNLNPLSLQTTRAELAVFYARVLNGVDVSKMYDYNKTIEAVKGGE